MTNKNKNGAKSKQRPSTNKTVQQAQVRARNKKTAQNAAKSGRKGTINFFRGVKQELSKVVWPTRDELVTDTVAVFVAVAVFAIAFWILDTGFLAALKHLLGITLS